MWTVDTELNQTVGLAMEQEYNEKNVFFSLCPHIIHSSIHPSIHPSCRVHWWVPLVHSGLKIARLGYKIKTGLLGGLKAENPLLPS
jgi:hypothetical protein